MTENIYWINFIMKLYIHQVFLKKNSSIMYVPFSLLFTLQGQGPVFCTFLIVLYKNLLHLWLKWISLYEFILFKCMFSLTSACIFGKIIFRFMPSPAHPWCSIPLHCLPVTLNCCSLMTGLLIIPGKSEFFIFLQYLHVVWKLASFSVMHGVI